MAVDDIPEFIKVAAGDLIRADDYNRLQRDLRNAVRAHHHVRPIGGVVDDTVTTDDATQIAAEEIADGAVTATKLAAAAVATANLADSAVTSAKLGAQAVRPNNIADGAVGTTQLAAAAVGTAQLAAGAVGTTQLANGSVTFGKMGFTTVQQGSVSLAPGAVQSSLVRASVTKQTVFFPTLAVSVPTAGTAQVIAMMEYHAVAGGTGQDVFIRVQNVGAVTASAFWLVVTFAT